MREMLEPIFGPNGAVIAQYLITLVVVLALVILVVWLVRRYAMGGMSISARGRLPRLAIVDAMSLDSRHRLVLVRRDNVEHLVLIGGATNLVVEPSIIRTKVAQRPGQPAPSARQPAQTASPPPPPAPVVTPVAAPSLIRKQTPAAAEEPIPFAPRTQRNAPARAAARPPTRIPVRPVELPPAANAPRRPTAIDSDMDYIATEVAVLTEEAIPIPRIVDPTVSDDSPAPPESEAPRSLVSELRSAGGEPQSIFAPRYDQRIGGAAMTETEPDNPPDEELSQPARTAAPTQRVTDLEQEMARLLGEISSGRSS